MLERVQAEIEANRDMEKRLSYLGNSFTSLPNFLEINTWGYSGTKDQ